MTDGVEGSLVNPEFNISPSLALQDSLNNLFAGFGSSSATANSGLSTGNWGTHSSSINIDSPTMSLSKMITFCGVALIGYWLFKKIARK